MVHQFQFLLILLFCFSGAGDEGCTETLEVCQEDFMSAVTGLVPSVTEDELQTYRDKKSFSNVT